MRTIVVTGAASGIGAATAHLLTERGDRVIGIDLADADISADLSTPAGRQGAVDAVIEACDGSLDGVVTCAGLSGNSPLLVRVNYFGTTELLDGLRATLAESDAPRVVAVASSEAIHRGDPELVDLCLEGDEEAAIARAETVADSQPTNLYPSSKHALARWLRRTCIASGWADAGIAVNAVGPGVVETPMSQHLFEDDATAAMVDRAVPMPLNGHAAAEDIAVVIGWLVSEPNSQMTGQIVFVDGGADATRRDDLAW